MHRLKGVAGGRLDVSVISAGNSFFPSLLVAFATRHPGIALSLAVVNRTELLRRLSDNATDLGVMGRPPDDPAVSADAFAPHPYVVVARPNHPLASRRRIDVSRIAQEPFIVREQGSDTRASMSQAFGSWLPKLHIAMEIGSNETIKQAVMAGMGIGFLSAHTLALELQAGALTILDVNGFPLMQNWYIVHRRQKRLPPVAAAFKAFVIEEGASLIERATNVKWRAGRNRPRLSR
jgi:LysR family transcriptional regulator, low CO2-responsive transcriptional regulator